MQSLVGVERLNFQQAGQMQSENDDDDTGNFREQRMILVGELTDRGCHRAQGDEHHAEPQNEGNGVQHHRPKHSPIRRLQVLDGGTRNQRHITRHEREHARRKK